MVPPPKTSNANALTLEWNLGLNKDLTDCVFNLSTAGEKGGTEVFYPTGNCGVIYDSTTGQQRLLQGHVNTISATVMGRDRQFIAPAETDDDGKDSQDPVEASRRLGQTMAIWDWTDTDRQEPLCSHRVPSNDLQTMVLFNRWNMTEIASNGKRRAIFWRWDIEEATKPSITEVPPAIFNCYCPVVNAKDLNQRVGDFTMTAFLPSTSQVATGTVDGDVVIWDYSLIAGSDPTSARHRRAVKVIRLAAQGVSLTVLKVHDDFIVVGSSEGAVRFYDFDFKIKAWFEDISAGTVKSISFRAPKVGCCSKNRFMFYCPFQPVPVEQSVTRRSVSPSKNLVGTRPGDPSNDGPFHCEPFLISTTSALIVNVDCELFYQPESLDRRGHLIHQGDPNCGLSHRLSVHVPRVIKYSPDGERLFVGFTNGHCKLLDASDLSELAAFRDSHESVVHIAFSRDSACCATAHSDQCVYLYKLSIVPTNPTAPREWVFGGKLRSHHRPIATLTFSGPEVGPEPRLFSIGQDGRLVEYSVKHSSEDRGLFITSTWTISQEARPLGAMWFPFGARGDHSKILVSDDHFKLKVWNTIDGNCRSTSLAPILGGPLERMVPLPRPDRSRRDGRCWTDRRLVRKDQVLGIIQLPLDGNPHKYMGIIAHPGKVAAMAVSYEGKYVFTVGGADLTLNQWAVNTESMATVSSLAKAADFDGIESYMSMIEGGREGELLKDMKQFFYYSQLRSQGEQTMRARKLDGMIPIAEIPNMMCALGFFPSQLEIQNMTAEVRYSRFFETGRYVEKITFEEFVRLYVNHRPTFSTEGRDVVDALLALTRKEETGPSGDDTDPDERLTYEEFEQCLKSLVQDENATIESVLEDVVDPVVFVVDEVLEPRFVQMIFLRAKKCIYVIVVDDPGGGGGL
ncbi:conserved hypothetical protein [Perkinsus marinus ATCC 50983]|uniref:Cilia- and flagella-associated protein 251 n=1 Tax=Perkinsus marinus (strain ATCC 50983 / TXsc) TaxID=423536 RepID=C5L2Y3_PERM5|nr:conserved hypothetical protein [Perkinsus marinus ATCC 50983]EER08870.1 conserved hypothetical protein [Perkinsus marinus ATCC 50983]|eukprot:XP_002777054.1 conserved hypothetical protein [Perkinsus marinus ATCC 50983]